MDKHEAERLAEMVPQYLGCHVACQVRAKSDGENDRYVVIVNGAVYLEYGWQLPFMMLASHLAASVG